MGRGYKIVLILALVALCALVALPVSSRSIVATVNGTSIREAIAQAGHGDTVRIAAGVYKPGNIIIRRAVTIIGDNFPVIDGEDKYELFTIAAPNVTITGLKMVNTGSGSINDISAVNAIESSHLRVINNQFDNTFFGIRLANCRHAVVEGNTLSSWANTERQIGNGIHAWKCDSITIRNNKTSGHRDGIYFEFVTNSLVENNVSTGNLRYGLHFMFSHHDQYRNNTFQNNGSGVAVMYTNFVVMEGNRFNDNWGPASYGLLLKDIGDSFIGENTFRNNTVGIFMEGSNRCKLLNNQFQRNGWAVKIQADCEGNIFERNNFLSNTFDVGTNGSLVLNSVTGNYWDNYQGYDLNRDGIGDVPYHPVSLYSMVVEKVPTSIMLWRSFLVYLMDNSERVVPTITPANMMDSKPLMRKL